MATHPAQKAGLPKAFVVVVVVVLFCFVLFCFCFCIFVKGP